MQVAVLNYPNNSVDMYENVDTVDIENWLLEKDYKIEDISYMCGESITLAIE